MFGRVRGLAGGEIVHGGNATKIASATANTRTTTLLHHRIIVGAIRTCADRESQPLRQLCDILIRAIGLGAEWVHES